MPLCASEKRRIDAIQPVDCGSGETPVGVKTPTPVKEDALGRYSLVSLLTLCGISVA